ncbi:MAG: hypothetical protein WCH46_04400 [bacterium]
MVQIFKKVMHIGITLCVISISASLFAQEVPPPPPHKADPAKVKEIRDRIMQKVVNVKHDKLREVLTMDDATATKFFSLYDPAEKEMVDLVKQRQDQEMKLLQLTKGGYSDADVDPTVNNIRALNEKIKNRFEDLDKNLSTVLTPRQRAKFLVFNREFNAKVREKIRNKIWQARHPQFKGRGARQRKANGGE